MSMTNCCICSETYDSDFQLESYKGECICDKCFEEKGNNTLKPEQVKILENLLRKAKKRKRMCPTGRAGFYCYCCNSNTRSNKP